MIELVLYNDRYRRETLQRIAAFWGFHSGLVGIAEEESFEEENSSLAGDLKNWTAEDHSLFVILKDGADVGFVHLHRIGPIVMQLEDLFVDEPMRGQGIATQAIALAEQEAQKVEGIEAMTIEVVTRNEAALHLYHKLGYDTMSMVSLRKEFGQNRRDRQAEFLGLRFRI